mmetsp:Transcript_49003/g.138959  ORF Transcript_49003/g.138959 Transcript_49003/m.138959 type:complete len:205 (-) Transcript_49003:244-858(-)
MTLYGLCKISAARVRTSFGQVAVKNSVCRFLGTLAKILRIWGSKPMSSMRSASSRHSFMTPSTRTWPPSRKSFKRPGQAMMACTPARYVCIWSRFGAPPYMATDLMPMHLPKRADSFSVCCASSRVGDITRSPGPCRCGCHCCRCMSTKAGNRNPRVLPLPVAAIPMTSLPWSASGQQYACTCDGPGKPALRSSTKSSGGNSRT